MTEGLGHISGNNERASNMPCPECGAVPTEQGLVGDRDKLVQDVTRGVLEILRADIQQESSHKAADKPTTVEQVPDGDDGSDGAMGETTTAEPMTIENMTMSDGRTIQEAIGAIHIQIAEASKLPLGLRNRDVGTEGATFISRSPLVPYIRRRRLDCEIRRVVNRWFCRF